jgi:hypothetical protein
MYRALKVAQTEVNETLLKLADEIMQASAAGSSQPVSNSEDASNINKLASLVYSLQSKQDELASAIQKLSETVMKLNTTTVNTGSTIPSIQPTSAPSEMVSLVPSVQPVYKSIDLTIPIADEVDEEDEADEEEVEVEEIEVEEEEIEVEEEVDEEVEVEEEVDEEVEVEEWTYKGMMFFKDSNHVVYSKDGDDIGEPIGKYDPIKKVLKKI